jgi:abelson tyrosine-protein kinase 1/abelson tyrosine-protein kinase 2
MIEVLQVGREEMPEAMKTLQRALEREVEKETVVGLGSTRGTVGTPSTIQTDIKSGVVQEVPAVVEGRRASLPVATVHDVSILERRKTIASGTQSNLTASTNASASGGNGSASDERPRDTLDREFIESGIDALRRVSNGPDMSLPSWTITKWVLFCPFSSLFFEY